MNITMAKAIFVTIAVLAASLDSGNAALTRTKESSVSQEHELLIHRRKLGKSGKGSKGVMMYYPPPPAHPDLHQHGYHPHRPGKSGKSTSKSGKAYLVGELVGWAGTDGHDDDDDDEVSSDDGFKWMGSGSADESESMPSADAMEEVVETEEVEDASDDENHWWAGVEYSGKSGKGSKTGTPGIEGQWWSGDESGADEEEEGDDNGHWWTGVEHLGKSGKGSKSATEGKASKGHKSGKGHVIVEHWGSWPPSPAPTPCGKGGKECPEKPDWLEETAAPTPCGKAGKECPPPVPAPKPGQTLPPICDTVPCSINGVPVSPPTPPVTPALTLPPICNTIPCSINGVNVSPMTPAAPPVTEPDAIDNVTDVPPPTPPAMPKVPAAKPGFLAPITVAPSAPSESGYPTWSPSLAPTPTIQTLTTSGNWFQTGKAYEVDSYTRARMGDLKDVSFSKQEVTSGGNMRSLTQLASSLGMAILVLRLVW